MAERDRTTLSLDDWKARAKAGTAPNDCRLVKAYSGVVERAEGEDPATARIRIRITTAERDRDRDTIAADGWKLDNYLKNPVVLFAHGYRSLPIARDTGIEIDAKGLIGHPEFCPDEMNPLGPMVERMLRGGFLNAASIGMAPLTYQFNEEERGVDFLTQELLEYSIVPVPANPGALVEARSAGIDVTPLREWIERALEETLGAGTIVLPKGDLTEAYRIVTREKVLFAVPSIAKSDDARVTPEVKTDPTPTTPAKDPPATPTPEEIVEASGDALVFADDCFEGQTAEDPNTFEIPAGLDFEGIVRSAVDDRAQRLLTALTGRLD